jgi:hypothetical protein
VGTICVERDVGIPSFETTIMYMYITLRGPGRSFLHTLGVGGPPTRPPASLRTDCARGIMAPGRSGRPEVVAGCKLVAPPAALPAALPAA